MVRRRPRDPRLHREDLSAKGLDISPGDEFRASAVHHVQLLAALVLARVGVAMAIDAFYFSSWGLKPQPLLHGSGLTVGGFLLARPLARRG